MKNILNKIEFHYTYIIMAFGLVITGHFINLIIFTSLIIIHELGHVIMAIIMRYKVNKIIIYPYGGITNIDTRINTKIENDYIRLQPENDYMLPIILKDISILGKAIGLYRKF